MKHLKNFIFIIIICLIPFNSNFEKIIAMEIFTDSNGVNYIIINDETAKVSKSPKVKGDIEILSEVNGRKVIGIVSEAFYYCPGITSIVIPNSVTDIGSSAFVHCSNLTKVIIPDGVKSISGAFYGCTSLTEIVIPDSVTSGIDEETFGDCFNLKSVKIGNNVPYIDNRAFTFCESLTEIIIPSSVTSIGEYAFYHCKNLTKIIIPNSVTSIGEGAFFHCPNLSEIIIPKNVTSIGVEAFGYNFYYDENWESTIVKDHNFTIYGYYGSEAERYAIKNEFNFIPLDSQVYSGNGDVNGDSEINTADVIFMAKAIANRITLTDEQIANANIDGVSGVSSDNLILLIKYLIGEIETLSISKK